MRAIEQRVPDRLLCVDCGLNYTENDLSLVLTGEDENVEESCVDGFS
jgi:hypothetical protein